MSERAFSLELQKNIYAKIVGSTSHARTGIDMEKNTTSLLLSKKNCIL
ncbi:hypothetical protein [Virgibacillus profundi]|nr:hypothetical protein [Virgibacillus profundi]